jgi:hyperosmotically inducible periplasmic protein
MRLSKPPASWFLPILLLALPSVVGAQQSSASLEELEIADKVRIALQRLPYYGPFDLIGFQVNGSTVTLSGWVYQAINKQDAEEEVKKIPGVARVVNNIEILPVSISDDKIRRAVFRAIYSDDFLQKYGTPILGMSSGRWGRNPWGRGRGGFGFGRGFGGPRGFANFPGSEPIGNYAIHIVVKNGRVGLFGTVHSEADKIKAGMDARGVFGVMDVDNELQVVTD